MADKDESGGSRGGKNKPVAKNPQSAEERGKKGAHVRKSKYSKGSKN